MYTVVKLIGILHTKPVLTEISKLIVICHKTVVIKLIENSGLVIVIIT